MRNILLLPLLGIGLAAPASAATLSLYNPLTAGVSDFSWSSSYDPQLGMTVFDIFETWTSNEASYIEFNGLNLREDYYVRKHVTNNTGEAWVGFNHELLDAAGHFEDVIYDDTSVYAPTGFSASNDIDGLSFAQDAGLPRLSNHFDGFAVDESYGRDFLEFMDGVIYSFGGGIPNDDVMTFGLRDNGYAGNPNSPFLLAQNALVGQVENPESPIPEPTTLVLLGGGLAAAAWRRNRRKK